MDQRFARSDAGRQEIKAKSRSLSRTARNLLLVMDATRNASDWMHLVHGATEADLRQLVSEGLIEPVKAPAGHLPTRSATLAEAIAKLTYDQLYNLLTSQAKERLGLIRGFKMVLDVEKCGNIDELRQLALVFFEQVKAQQGENAAKAMRMALGAA
jgi:hypothetical protein